MLLRVARWRRLVGFVAKWFRRPLAFRRLEGARPEQLDAAATRLGALPRALREAHRLLGRRPDVLGPTVSLIPTDALRSRAATVVFITRSYGQPVWYVEVADLALADPPGWWLGRRDPPLSELFLALAISALVRRAEVAGHSRLGPWRDGLTPSVRAAVATVVPRGAEDYRLLPVSLPSRGETFRGDADTLVMAGSWVRSNRRDYPLVVLTRTEAAWNAAVARLGPLLPFDELRRRRPGFTAP